MDSWTKLGDAIGHNMVYIVPLCLLGGIFLPGFFGQLVPVVPALFAFITFQGSLSNDFGCLRHAFAHPVPMLVSLAISQLLLPLLGWALGTLFVPDPDLVCGIVLECAVPIAVTSTIWVSLYAGDMSLALGTLLISTCLSPIALPLALKLLLGASVTVDALGMVSDMLWMVAIPALLGTALNSRTKGWAAHTLSPALAPLARILTVLVIAANSTGLSSFVFGLTPQLASSLALIGILAASGYVWGFLAAKLLRLPRASGVSVTFCAAMKNISVGAVLAQESFGPATLFPVMAGTLFNQFLAALFGRILAPAFERMEKTADTR